MPKNIISSWLIILTKKTIILPLANEMIEENYNFKTTENNGGLRKIKY